ncbi:MAG: DUF4411 family protein [Bacteroidota bacterium]
MTEANYKKYCLDANFFIEAWNKYYSPDFCSDYWKVIAELGEKEIIFIPEIVKEEVINTDTLIKEWFQLNVIPVHMIDENVTSCLKLIYSTNTNHQRLVDNTKGRSIADPWVIAHALNEKAIVVTKEEKITNPASQRIKIPNVCDNMGVKWMNDFDFIREIGIRFSCGLKKEV